MVTSEIRSIPESTKFEHALVRAVAWTGASMWVAQFFSWVSTIYVARILSPTDYGLFAMATVYLGFVTLLSEFGIGSAVIVLREQRGRELAELNTISVLVGLLCAVVSYVLAHWIGAFFSSPELPLMIIVMSLAFVVASFRVVPDSVLQQELRFKLIAHIDGIKALVQAAATTIAAIEGMHYWSLVIGYLVGTASGTILTLLFRRHKFAWPRPHALKPALKLSRDVLISRICWYVYSNSDFLVAGKMLGQVALGVYRLAWSISNIAVDKISAMVLRTSQAFFSNAQKDYGMLRRYLLGLTEGLALVTIPGSVGLILVADQFVNLALGPKWAGVVLPLRLLALYAVVRSITPLVAPILNVTGNSGFVAWTTLWTSIVLPVGFYISSRWGASGIAAAWVIMYPISAIPLYYRAFHEIKLSFRQYFSALAAAIWGTVALTGAVLSLRYNLPPGLPLIVQLLLLSATGATAYVLFIFLFYRQRIRALMQIVTLLRSSSSVASS